MTNPAQALHRQLSAWNTQTAASNARLNGVSDPENRSRLAHELRIACMHIEAIREFLIRYEETGQDATMWRDALDRWTLGIFLFPHGWENPQSASLQESDLLLLQSLGDVMQVYVPVLAPGSFEKIRGFVQRIRLLADESQLDANLKRHLLNVLTHIDWCLDNFELVGEFELEKAWVQLAATVHLVEECAGEADKSKWLGVVKDWLHPFTVGSLAGMAGNVLTEVAVRMIGR